MWPFDRRPAPPPAAKRPPRPTQLYPQRLTDADLRRMRLESEMDHARTQAMDARQEVETISSDHLQTVLHLPRAERAKHVDDPELTSADRQTLIDALTGEAVTSRGWRPPSNSSRRDTLLRLWGHNRHRAPGMIRALVLIGPICTVGVAAYSNTGEKRVDVVGKELLFQEPDGTQSSSVVGGGRAVVLVDHLGRSFVRVWRERQGYALASVTVD